MNNELLERAAKWVCDHCSDPAIEDAILQALATPQSPAADEAVHVSDCAVHDGPALPAAALDNGDVALEEWPDKIIEERPIPFSAPMVRAIIEGRKSQTRRVAKLPAAPNLLGSWEPTTFGGTDARGVEHEEQAAIWHTRTGKTFGCPYGIPGDRLWVREAWRTPQSYDSSSGADLAERCIAAGYKRPWAPIQYEADGARDNWVAGARNRDDGPGRYRHARFMPRWASRILLEVTDVRVERLQDISDADAIAEGIRQFGDRGYHTADGKHYFARAVDSYASLWESINGAGSWEANPWVWVVAFRMISP